jgi:hypothetical protein
MRLRNEMLRGPCPFPCVGVYPSAMTNASEGTSPESPQTQAMKKLIAAAAALSVGLPLAYAPSVKAGDGCWNYYGEIKCSLSSGPAIRYSQLRPITDAQLCADHPTLAAKGENWWARCAALLGN